jgi:hypothetical protein
MHAIIAPVTILAFIVFAPIDLFRCQTDRFFANHLLIRAAGLKGYSFLAMCWRAGQGTESGTGSARRNRSRMLAAR